MVNVRSVLSNIEDIFETYTEYDRWRGVLGNKYFGEGEGPFLKGKLFAEKCLETYLSMKMVVGNTKGL